MNRTAASVVLAIALVASAGAGTAVAQSSPAPPEAPAGFGWLRQLAGSCWRGEYANSGTADRQCYEWQYGRLLRGTIELTGAQGDGTATTLRGDSVWAWSTARNRIELATWANNGTLTTGVAQFDGELLRVTMGASEGAAPTLRTTWQRLDADAFLVRRERRDGDAWRETLVVRYTRVR